MSAANAQGSQFDPAKLVTTRGCRPDRNSFDYRHHPLHNEILPLVTAGILQAASLTEFTVDVRQGESEDHLLTFGADVAALCTFASAVGVSVAMIELLVGDIPKHSVARDTIRLLRNAVMHGGELPTQDRTEFRQLFDKWQVSARSASGG